ISIMYMVEQLDAGDMIAQNEVHIDHTDTVGHLHDKLSVVGADLLKETLPNIFDETIQPTKQDEEKATFAPNIRRELERIDWTKDSLQVYNHIRGLNPWPVAYSKLADQQIKIWQANLIHKDVRGIPGEIVEHTDDHTIIVACG